MSESYKLIEAWVKGDNDILYILILTDSMFFKYLVSITPSEEELAVTLSPQSFNFTAVPLGPWNISYVRHTKHGYFLESQEFLERPRVGPLWHPHRVDIVDLPGLLPQLYMQKEQKLVTETHKKLVTLPEHMRSNSDTGIALLTMCWQKDEEFTCGHINVIASGCFVEPEKCYGIRDQATRVNNYKCPNCQRIEEEEKRRQEEEKKKKEEEEEEEEKRKREEEAMASVD
ncbi:hypothetical protein HJFPF1_11968 [Paramyrothecium foliicola]|nr:hypothetical protein HJFPF1_11968 [Paramyrothecium foliicola]